MRDDEEQWFEPHVTSRKKCVEAEVEVRLA